MYLISVKVPEAVRYVTEMHDSTLLEESKIVLITINGNVIIEMTIVFIFVQ